MRISRHRVADAIDVDLSMIKYIRLLVKGSTVNDVVLAIVGGALRRYLTSKDELPESTLIAMAPISVRKAGEHNTMGNQVTMMFPSLGTHIEDCSERLRHIAKDTTLAKEAINAIGAREIAEVSKTFPALFLGIGAKIYAELGLAERLRPDFNTVVTNVPGPPEYLYSVGAKLVYYQGLLCLYPGMALGHIVLSYVDRLNIGFTACRNVIADPGFYRDCLLQSFEEYAAETQEKDGDHQKQRQHE